VVASAIHPDTGDLIPRLFRISSYVPVSIPVLFGMILSAPTTRNIMFWQWFNQSYSAYVNYANRNASSSLDMTQFLMVYMTAVAVSIGIGLGTKRILSPFSSYFTGAKGLFMNFGISFLAVGSAGCANVMLMRGKEMTEGIILKDEDGNELGKSQIIGKRAVIQTGMTRYIIPLVPLLAPTLIFYFLENKKLIPKN
jgi:sideroflexin-5